MHVVPLSTSTSAVHPETVAPPTFGTVHFSSSRVLHIDVVGLVFVLLVLVEVLDVVLLIRSLELLMFNPTLVAKLIRLYFWL